MKLSIATFNVRELTQEYKQEQLSRDMTKYKLDVISIQETKIREDVDKNIPQIDKNFWVFSPLHYLTKEPTVHNNSWQQTPPA